MSAGGVPCASFHYNDIKTINQRYGDSEYTSLIIDLSKLNIIWNEFCGNNELFYSIVYNKETLEKFQIPWALEMLKIGRLDKDNNLLADNNINVNIWKLILEYLCPNFPIFSISDIWDNDYFAKCYTCKGRTKLMR